MGKSHHIGAAAPASVFLLCRSRSALVLSVSLLAALSLPLSVHAANRGWTGTGAATNANWSLAANWGGTVPVAGDDLTFNVTTGLTNTNDLTSGILLRNITFGTAAGNFFLSGNAISSEGSFNNNTTSGTNTLAFNIALTLASHGFNVATGGTMLVSGSISGASSAINLNSGNTALGTLILSGSNSFGGGVTVTEGVLDIRNNNALGATAAGTTVLSGGELRLSGGITVNEALTNSSTGSGAGATTGGLRNVSGDNTWGGLITLGAAARINSDSGTLFITNTGTITGATFGLSLGGAGNISLASVIGTTSGTLTKDGSGTATLTAANTYTGGTTLNGGTLSLGNAGALGTSGTISFGGGTLQYSGSNTTDYSGRFSTAANQAIGIDTAGQSVTFATALTSSGGSLTKLGAGTLTLAAANTFSGSTVVQAGVLVLSNNLGLQNSAYNTDGGGNLAISGTTPTFGGLSGAVDLATEIVSGYSGVTSLTLNPASGVSQTYSGAITDGAVGMTLTKTGAGTQVLSGANTYTGGTAINAGTLSVANANALGSTGTISFGGGTLQYGAGGTTDYSSRFSTAASQAINIDTGGQSVTFGSALTSSGGSLTKLGLGTLALSGANSYTGGTSLNGGTLSLGSTGALGTTGTISFGGGTLQYSAGNTTDYSSRFSTAASQAISIDTGGQSISFGTALTSSGGSLTKQGEGTLTLSLNNTYNGATTLIGGTLRATTSTGALGAGALSLGGGILELANDSGLNFARNTTVTGNTQILSERLNAGVGVTHTLGTLSIGASTLTAGTDASVTSGLAGLTFGAATLTGNATFAVNSGTLLTFGSTMGGDFTKTFDGAGNTTVNGVVSGAGGMVKSGTGTLTLAAANTFTGNLTISNGAVRGISNLASLGGVTSVILAGGNLELDNNTGLAYGEAVVVSNNATITTARLTGGAGVTHTLGTLNIGAQTMTVATDATLTSGTAGLTFGAVTLRESGATFSPNAGTLLTLGAVSGAGFDLFVGGDGNTTFNGAITNGAGSVTKNGAGTMTISVSSTYTGGTTINAGTLATGGNQRMADAGALTLNGPTAVFNLGANNETLGVVTLTDGTISGSGGTLTASRYAVENGLISAILAGAGGMTKTGQGTVTLSGLNTFTGNLTNLGGTVRATTSAGALGGGSVMLSGGDLELANDANISFSDPVLVTSNTTITSDRLTLGAGITSTLGTLTNGAQTISIQRGANVNSGTAGVTFGAVTLNASGGTYNVASGAQLTLGAISGAGNSFTVDGAGNTTISGIIGTGAGALTKDGSGTLTLSAVNTYTGGTTINAGAVTITAADRLANAGALILNGPTAVFNIGTFNEAVGAVTLTEGTISGTTGVLTGSSYDLQNGSVTANLGGAGINLAKTGSGTVVLSSATNSYTGTTTVGGGVLRVTNLVNANTNSSIGAGTTVILTNGGVLDYAGTTNSSMNRGINLAAGNGGIGVSNGSTALTISGVISNTGSLSKFGAGTLILAGANTYNGGTLVSAGALQGDTTGLQGNITNNASLVFDQAANGTFAGDLSGNGSLIKTNSGTLILTGANSYSGATTIGGGTLSVSTSAAVAGTSGINMANGTTFLYTGAAGTIDRNFTVTGGTGTLRNTGGGTLTLSGGLSKNGTVLQFNSGNFNITGVISGANANSDLIVDSATVTLSNANTYNGPTYVRNAGVLNANVAGALPTNTRTAMHLDDTGGGGSTLGLGANQAVASLTGADTSVVALGANTLTIGTSSGSTTFAGVISGTGGLVKDGGSTQILTGSNTMSGPITISAGTLQIGNGSLGASIGSVSAITNDGSLVFKLGSATHASSTVINAQISGTGSLTQDSPGGIVFLDNTNSYSGGTTIVAGEIHASTASSLGTGSVTLTGTNATSLAKLHYSNAASPLSIGALTLNGNAEIALESLNSIQSTGAITVNSTNNFLSLNTPWNQGTNILISGTSLTLGGGASIFMTGPLIDDATLALGSSLQIGRSVFTFGSNATSFYLVNAGTNLDLLWVGGVNSTWGTNAANWQVATNGLNPSGTNLAFLDGDNVYFGNTAASNSPITVAAGGVAAEQINVTNTTGTVVFNGGSVLAHNLTNSGSLVVSNNLTLIGDSPSLTNGYLVNNGSGNVTLAGNLLQGQILQAGSGTVTLAASNNFAGGTTISNGTVVATANNGFGSGALSVNGGTADVGTTSQSLGQVTLNDGSIIGAGSITSSETFQVVNGSISANLLGTVGLTKSGIGTVTLSGSNSYTGVTHINGGTLQISSDANLGNAAGGLHLEGGTLKTAAGLTNNRAVTLTGGGTFDTDGNAVTLAGVISGGGALTKIGLGTLTLTGTNIYTGGTTVTAGTLAGNTASLQGSITNDAAVVFNQTTDGTYAGNMTGTGTLAKTGAGTLTLSGVNSYSGGTTVGAGKLLGDTTSLQGAIANDAVVEFNQSSSGTYAGAMSGTGSLAKSGAGTVTLSGANTYIGATTISMGTLALGGAGELSTSTTVAVSSGATFDIGGRSQEIAGLTGAGSVTNSSGTLTVNKASGAESFSGSITGAGALAKSGAGTLTLTGANNYTGGTAVNAGALVGDTTSLQGAITNDAAVVFNQTSNGTYAGAMSGAGSLVKTGAAFLQVTGTNSFSGQTTVSSGGLEVDGSLASSAVVVQNGATLSGSGTVGATTVESGGTVNPGNSPGTLSINGVATWLGGGNYNWQIYDAEGTAGNVNGWDLLDIDGELDLTQLSDTNKFNINLWSLSGILSDTNGPAINFDKTQGYTWTIATATGGINGFDANKFNVNLASINGTAGFANVIGTGSIIISTNGSNLNLVYTPGLEPIPEPGTWAAAALLLGGAAYARWRRRDKVS
ncbi:MAG: hypothetical protein FGM15_08080 [Chthoniobacterales bacterium]|nr:hypothetical protein [Chthoniobacterales bacterium]